MNQRTRIRRVKQQEFSPSPIAVVLPRALGPASR